MQAKEWKSRASSLRKQCDRLVERLPSLGGDALSQVLSDLHGRRAMADLYEWFAERTAKREALEKRQ